MDLEDDEVVRELDVYYTNELDLILLQFPLKPVYADPPENITSAKYKATHKKFDFNIPYPFPTDSQQNLTSSLIKANTSLGVGVIRNNSLHITHLKDVHQIRPNMKDLKPSGETIEMMSDDDEESNEEKQSLQQIQIKRKESEKAQSARLQSFSYLHTQVENEPWIPLTFHEIDSVESNDQFVDMYFDPKKTKKHSH